MGSSVKKTSVPRIISHIVAVICLGVLAVGIFRKMGKPPGGTVSCKNCNVIIVSLDTLSAENLSCYGYERNTSPNLCAFADSQVNFPYAFANSTYTLPTYVTMFTGLYPTTHKIREVGAQKLPESVPFLPSILKDSGYKSIFLMDKENPHMPMDTVYYRGIDTQFDEDTIPWSRAFSELENVTRKGDKAFLFIHSYYVHPPYKEEDKPLLDTQDAFDWMFLREADKTGNTQNFIDYLIVALGHNIINGVPKDPATHQALLRELTANAGNLNKQQAALFRYTAVVNEYRNNYDPLIRLDTANPRQMSYLKAIYDERIRRLDSGPIRQLLDFIRKPSIAANTIIIITSDHGEEFGEHGSVSHTTLYNPNTHIVLAMAIPGLNNRRVLEYVQTADITPTVIDLLGIPTRYTFDGQSIVEALSGRHLPRRLLVAEAMNKTTLRLGKWKLFVDMTGDAPVPIELYDTEKDPKEQNNILFDRLKFAQNILNSYKRERPWFMPLSF